MNERDIRLLFDAEHWHDAIVHYDANNKGWTIQLNPAASKQDEQQVLTSKRGQTRVFKTSDTALGWCREIGFRKITVKLDGNTNSDSHSTTILLVEDNDDDIELTLRAFKKGNDPYDVVVVKDGEEALDYLFARGDYHDRTELPSLILLDLNLPKLNGHAVLKEIRKTEELKKIPVVILSTSDEQSDVEKGYELGTNSYILKPVDYDAFCDTITNLKNYWLNTNMIPPELTSQE